MRRLAILPHFFALALLAFFSVRLIANLRFLHVTRHNVRQPIRGFPRVSVLIPARNEVATISNCVTSLLQQRYPNLEILVLDDGSTDGTSQVLDTLKAEYPELTVIHTAGAIPLGWNGKSHACYQLAMRATGDWLLFTDADTAHMPGSIEQGLAQAAVLNAALVSVFPYQRAVTWSERIIVSFIIDFLPLVAVDLEAIWRGRSRRIVANGQYLLAHARSYHATGGHLSIARALVDDFALARRFRAMGFPVALVDGTSMMECRMYRSFREVLDGFSKNLLDALTLSTSLSGFSRLRAFLKAPLFAWCYACLFVIPFFHVISRKFTMLATLEIVWLLVLRALVGLRFRRPSDEILTTPLAAWGTMAIGVRAIYRRWRKRPITWKGRIINAESEL